LTWHENSVQQAAQQNKVGKMLLSWSRHCETTALHTWARHSGEQRYVRERFHKLMGANQAAAMHDALTTWRDAAYEQRTLIRRVSKIVVSSSVRCLGWALLTWRQVFLSSKHHGALAVGINASSRHHIISLTSLLLRVSLLSWKHTADTRRRIRFVLLQKRFLLDQRTSKITLHALHQRCCRLRLLFVSSSRVAHRKWRSVIRIVLHKWYHFLQEAKEIHDQERRSLCATVIELHKRSRRLCQRCICGWAGIVSERSWHQRICMIFTSKLFKTHLQHLLARWRGGMKHAQQQAVMRGARFWNRILAAELNLQPFFTSWRHLQATNSRQHQWSSFFLDWVGGYHSRQSLHRALESWKDYLQAEKARHIQNGRRNMRLSWIQFRVLRCGFRPILDAWKRVHAAQLHKSLKNRLVTKSVKSRYGLLIQKRHLIAWFERAFQDKMYAANTSTRVSRTYKHTCPPNVLHAARCTARVWLEQMPQGCIRFN
jgi:hypothetical protein